VSQYLNTWLKSHAENVAPKTAEGYATMIRVYIDPLLGKTKLQNLEPHHLSSLYTSMLEKNLSSATRAHCHRTLRKALGDALRQKVIGSNPALSVTAPRQRRSEPETWTTDQFNEFLVAAEDDEFRDYFELAALTGMRRSEITGLKWDKVDLDRKVLRVTETLQRIQGLGLVTGTPKSRGSRRVISLSTRTIALLKEVRRLQLEQQVASGSAYMDSGYAFVDALGSPYDGVRPSKHFLKIARSTGLPKQSLHGLRHLHATALLAAGTHVKVVSERLGHSSVAFTMDTYQHLLPGMQEQAAEAIDAAFA